MNIYRTMYDGDFVLDSSEILEYSFFSEKEIDCMVLNSPGNMYETFVVFWKRYRDL